MATKDDSDIPESGAVFTFGKSKFADNQPNKFWVKNDKVLQIACGDEHTALITESGRVFMFGPNDWGQLGLGNDNKVSNKPSCIKSLKHDKSRLVACGRSHTIVSTVSGHVYSFGSNSEGQLGIKDTTGLSTPKRIESLPEEEFKMLEAGSDSSVALTEDGRVYVWGGNEDGKLGLGKVENAEEPVLLAMERPAVCVACGYYHTAIVSDDGKLYTMGESENGKLGLPEDLESTNVPQHVADITEPVKWVACGSSHTVALTESGEVYVFGDGDSGQLGLGTDVLSCNTPTLLKLPFKVAHVFCGQSFTACISEKGQLYTFGDGRHGKLAHGSDIFSNQYKPFHSKRFTKFLVDKVACGGCHMIVTGRPKALNGVDEGDNDGADEMKKTLISQPIESSGSPSLTRTLSARERRRDEVSRSFSSEMNQTLPPPGQSRILPSLSATMPALKSSPKPVIDDVMENGFVPKLQNGKLSDADSAHDDTEDEEHASEKHKKRTKLPRPKASPRRLPQSSQQKDDKDDGSKANTGSGSDGDMENEEDTTDGGERKKRKKKRKPSRTEEEPQNEEKEKAEDSWNDDDGSDIEDKKENKAVKELESALVEKDGGKTDEENEDDGDSMIGEEKAEKDEEDVKEEDVKEKEGDEKNGKESDDESKGPVPIPRKQKAEDSEDNEEEDKESSDKKDSAVDLRPESDKEEEEEEVEKESKLDKDLASDQEDDKKSKKDKKEKDKKKKKDEEEEEEIKEEVKEKSKEEDDEEEDEKDSKKKGKDKKKDKKDKKKEKEKDKKKKKGKGEDEEEEKDGEEEEKEKSDKKSKDKKKDKKDKKKGKDKDENEDEEEDAEEDEEDDGKGDKKKDKDKKDKDKKDKDKKKKKGKEDEKEKDENGNNEKPPPKKSRTCTIL